MAYKQYDLDTVKRAIDYYKKNWKPKISKEKRMSMNKKVIEFENELMPPGTIIKEWYSKVNYQMMRTEPSLPIIDGESSYHIQVNMSDFELYLVRMVFYDRYENEAGTLIIREPEMDFRCPLKTYSYRVQLINAGGTKMHFHSFVITEKEG